MRCGVRDRVDGTRRCRFPGCRQCSTAPGPRWRYEEGSDSRSGGYTPEAPAGFVNAAPFYLPNLIAGIAASVGVIVGSIGPWASVLAFTANAVGRDGTITGCCGAGWKGDPQATNTQTVTIICRRPLCQVRLRRRASLSSGCRVGCPGQRAGARPAGGCAGKHRRGVGGCVPRCSLGAQRTVTLSPPG